MASAVPRPPPGFTYDANGNLIPIGGASSPLPAPGSAGPGSYPTPPGWTYDPATGQYTPTNGYSPGSTPTPGVPGAINIGPGNGPQTGPLDPTKNYGINDAPAPTGPPASPSGGGGAGGGPGGGLTLQPPAPAPPFGGFTPPPSYTPPPAFALPTIADAMAQPGYQFQVQQGQNALQDWAAAKGTLNDSETAQGLEQFGQNAAQADYANVVAQDLQQYNTNYQTQYTDPYAIKYQGWAAGNANAQTSWQDAYNAWLAQNQLLQGEQGLVIQGSNAGL